MIRAVVSMIPALIMAAVLAGATVESARKAAHDAQAWSVEK